jgi:hypothetical protein
MAIGIPRDPNRITPICRCGQLRLVGSARDFANGSRPTVIETALVSTRLAFHSTVSWFAVGAETLALVAVTCSRPTDVCALNSQLKLPTRLRRAEPLLRTMKHHAK